MQTVDIRLVTQNVQDLPDLSRPKTRKCIYLAAAQGDVLNTQEMAEKQDAQDMDRVLPPSQWYHLHRPTECEVAVRKSLLAPRQHPTMGASQGRYRISGHKAHRSPNRVMTWSCWSFVGHPELTPFVNVDTHWVSHPKADPFGRRSLRSARTAMSAHLEQLMAGVCNVAVSGDFNIGTPKLTVPIIWVAGKGLDHIGVMRAPQANWGWNHVSSERHPSPSDHDTFVANMQAVWG